MRTEKQQQASRENGARSQGPTTDQGKANSARNATTHGLTAKNPILLSVEDHQAFHHLRQEYENLFQPANIVERQLIDEMVSVQWRRQRAEMIEAATLDFAMDRMASGIATSFHSIDADTRVALAFNHEANENRTLHTVQRIAAQLSRQYLRLLKAFQNLRANPIQSAPTPEPEPRTAPPPAGPEKENLENEPGDSPRSATILHFPKAEPKPEPASSATPSNEICENEPGTDGLPNL